MAGLAFSTRMSFAVLAVFIVLSCSGGHLKSEALVLKEEFSGKIVTDMKVNLPADDIWAVYKSHDFGKLLLNLSPSYYKQIEYVEGYGGVGTVLNVTLQPEFGSRNWLEVIIDVNDKAKTVLHSHVKGTFLDSGFTLFQSEHRVIKQEKTSCVIRTTTSFKLNQQSLANATLVRPSWLTPVTVADYVNSMKSTPLTLREEFRGELVSEMSVNLPANEIWDVYRSKDFGRLLLQLSPAYFRQIDYIKGDGGVGTILNITLRIGDPSQGWLDEIIVLDDRTKTRLLRHIKGGVLNAGYTEFQSGYRVIKKVHKSCVIRAFTPFKIRADSVSTTSNLEPNWGTAMTIANYVNSMKL